MSGAAPRDSLLEESEEDWVDMKILEGWSHGYLQASPAEARLVMTALI